MKIVSFLISVLFLILIAAFVFANVENFITFEIGPIQLKANVGFVMLFSVIVGSLTTVILGMSLGWINSRGGAPTTLQKWKVENEKLKTEIESDKVKHLEAKIKTLEEALKTVTTK